MSEKNYIIKIYDREKSSLWGQVHFFKGTTNSKESYYPIEHAEEAAKLTKKTTLKAIKEIEYAYEINPKNGNLSKIEILDADTLQIVNFNAVKDDVSTSRFDLMDFD